MGIKMLKKKWTDSTALMVLINFLKVSGYFKKAKNSSFLMESEVLLK
jgi:hypothetical protein